MTTTSQRSPLRRALGSLTALGAAAALLVLAPATAHAEVPTTITTQGYLTNVDGQAAQGDFSITLALYTQATGGSPFWSETQDVHVTEGFFDALMGTDVVNPLLSSMFRDHAQVWLGVAVDEGPGVPAGGEPELPRTPLTSVGYAFVADYAGHAETADSAGTAGYADAAGSAATAESATTAQLADHATTAGTAQSADAANTAISAQTSDYAATAGSADTAESADYASEAGHAETAETADAAHQADLATFATNAGTAQTATVAGYATNAGSADSAQTAVTATTAQTANTALSANTATTAQTAQTANSANTADFATQAGSAQTAQTAVTAQGLNCVNCVSLTALSFDVATQAELNAALAQIDIPDSINGMGGGTVTSDVQVIGAVTANSFTQSGRKVCDESGNCGQTLARLVCFGTNDTPRYDSASGQWLCGTANVATADRATIAGSAEDLFCTGCVGPGELTFDPATQSELNQALQQLNIPDSVDGLGGGTITSAVTVQGQLSGTTIRQNGWPVCDQSGNCGQILADISCAPGSTKAKYDATAGQWTCVPDVATSADHATTAVAAQRAGDVDCIGCVTTSELAFDTATQAELDAAFSQLQTLITSGGLLSVDGLAGGMITSSVSVQGEIIASDVVRAPAFAQNGNVVCDASGNCGQSLANLNCTTAATIRFNPTLQQWECAESGGANDPGPACTGLDEYKHWTGTVWECRSINSVGATGQGRANGYRVIDAWGFAWDGVQRAPATWPEAKATCEGQGGRLPTVTEVWRGNAGSEGTGNLGSPNDSTYLWTLVPSDHGDSYITIRVSDGGRTEYDKDEQHAFRCTWPNRDGEAFFGNDCYGPPGAECKEFNRVWNADQWTRPTLPYVAALYECNFYNASMPTNPEIGELIRNGWGLYRDTNRWHWMADAVYWYNGNFGHGGFRWSRDPEPWWGFDDADSPQWGSEGSVQHPSSWVSFRCIGKKDPTLGVPPAATPCMNGNCFTTRQRRALLVADGEDRSAVNYGTAAETCRLLGGALPTISEAMTLINQGWEPTFDSLTGDGWMWSGEPIYWYNNAGGYGIYRWSSHQDNTRWDWRDTNHAERGSRGSSYRFRCVWHENLEADFTTCAADERQVWDGAAAAYTCEAATEGSSNGNANPAGQEFTDAWGNKWDTIQRGNATWTVADADCKAMGGRLPLASELWRVRYNQAVVGPEYELGTSASSDYNWSSTPEWRPDRHIIVCLSDGNPTDTADTSSYPYFCIWPGPRADALSGRQCYGTPGEPCFEIASSRLRVDMYDRIKLPFPSAAYDCEHEGGWLPSGEDMMRITHNEAPNATNQRMHSSEVAYWYNSAYGQHVFSWTEDTDGPGWGYNHGNEGTMVYEYSYNHFRCVFSDRFE